MSIYLFFIHLVPVRASVTKTCTAYPLGLGKVDGVSATRKGGMKGLDEIPLRS
jgi:hypothetical protein